MLRRASTLAVVLTALLATAFLTGGGVAVGGASATDVAQCTTITESGSYELTSDLTYDGQDDCITVAADDVTLDGNGHTITFDTSGDGPYFAGAGVAVLDHQNVTVTNVTFGDHARLGIGNTTGVTVEDNRFEWSLDAGGNDDLTVRDNVFANGDSDIDHSTDVHLLDNTFQDVSMTVSNDAANVTARGNDGAGSLVVDVRGGSAVISNNSLWSIDVSGFQGTSLDVHRNDVGDGGADLSSKGPASITNNTVAGGRLALGGTTDDMYVAHNTVTDSDVGVWIAGGYDTGPKVTLVRNVVTDNGIGVKTYSNRPQIHHNDLSNNTDAGVVYTQDNGVVNATSNFWGGRPSSIDDPDAPFEDPTTGALANGTGSAVSEGAAPAGVEPGISNVQFDPWLDAAPQAGVVAQASGDSGGETTTTVSTTTTESTTSTTATTSTTTTEQTTTTTATTTNETTTTTEQTTTTTSTDEPTTTTATTTTNEQTTTSANETTTSNAGTSTTSTTTTTVCPSG